MHHGYIGIVILIILMNIVVESKDIRIQGVQRTCAPKKTKKQKVCLKDASKMKLLVGVWENIVSKDSSLIFKRLQGKTCMCLPNACNKNITAQIGGIQNKKPKKTPIPWATRPMVRGVQTDGIHTVSDDSNATTIGLGQFGRDTFNFATHSVQFEAWAICICSMIATFINK